MDDEREPGEPETELHNRSESAASEATIEVQTGRYRLLRRIGEGGMGIVWEAEQEHPVRRRVALKLIKHGLEGEQILARFAAERQALALMNHPNVARVLDAGTDASGRPFFVMEYIQGIPLSDYCDRHNLTTRERLELLIQACAGVQHAHQKGVIHRDLKPSNLLVELREDRPVVRIIDFGVAKAIDRPLTEQALFTEFGQVVGTPEYMSPEQADMTGLDIDTRTDVYSLGVVLYELLVGALPFDPKELRRAGLEEMRRRIREETPPKPSTRLSGLGESWKKVAEAHHTDPSTLLRECRGDLDWITMKALEKDRTRRYASASELASDLRRHLANEPVLAGPPSASYRVRKFVKRHRAGVAFAATASVLVLVGLAGTTYGMVRAVRAERRATLEAETANRITDFMLNMFAINEPGEARGKTVTAKEILDRAAEGIRSGLTDQPALKARLMEAMGKVYRSLGLYGEALPLLESAVATQTAVFGPSSSAVAATTTTLAGMLIERGRAKETIPLLERAIAIERATLPPGDLELARALNNMGNAHRALGQNDQALPFLLEALAVRENALGPDHVDVAKLLVSVGSARLYTGDPDGARRDLERALSIYERKLGPDHLDVARPLDALATQSRKSGDLVRASDLLTRVLAIKEKNLGPEHPGLVVSLVNLATVQQLRGELALAESTFERADTIARAKLEPDHRDAVNARLALDDLRRARGQ